MMRHEVKIGTSTYFIAKYEPFLGLEILGDLQQQFMAPILASATPGSDHMSVLLVGLGEVSRKMDGKTLAGVAKKILLADCISVSINGSEPRRLDEGARSLAMGGPEDIVDLCVEVVTLNFRPFLTRFGARIGQVMSRAGEQQAASPLN